MGTLGAQPLAAYGESGDTGDYEITEVSEVSGVTEDYELDDNFFCFRGFVVSARILQNGISDLESLLTKGHLSHFVLLS